MANKLIITKNYQIMTIRKIILIQIIKKFQKCNKESFHYKNKFLLIILIKMLSLIFLEVFIIAKDLLNL